LTSEGSEDSERHEICEDRTDEDKNTTARTVDGGNVEDGQNSSGKEREDSKTEQDARSEGNSVGSLNTDGTNSKSSDVEGVVEGVVEGEQMSGGDDLGVDNKAAEGDWAEDGWGQEDWNVSTEEHRAGDVTSGSGQEKEFATLLHRVS